MATATCPSCTTEFATDSERTPCPRCGTEVTLDLAVRVICSCGTTLKAPQKMRGRVVKCPRCSRAVSIPRADEAEEQRTTTIVGRALRWVFGLALIPALLALQAEVDDPYRRVEAALKAHPEAAERAAEARTLARRVREIPGGRAEGAALRARSKAPLLYGAASLAFLLGFVALAFRSRRLRLADMGLAAGAALAIAAVATWLAGAWLGRPADADAAGRSFVLALLAGGMAEAFKVSVVAGVLQRRPTYRGREAIELGLVVGAACGVGAAVVFAISQLNGIARTTEYWVLFVTAAALQAVWGGTSAILLRRFERSSPGTGALLKAAAGPALLHVVFALCFLRTAYIPAFAVGIASFGLFHALHWWAEQTEAPEAEAETIRL